ncbi:MAG TPA: disulfide bond formation protein B [Afifellaceae bacterium]|nr:disulfide bond formation protein B [Afifellaceae bacterium]
MTERLTNATASSGRARRQRPTAAGTPSAIALAVSGVALATILAALAFEHVGGYQPCPLCLMQRDPYYFGVPIALGAAAAAYFGAPRWLVAVAFAAFAGLMGYGTVLAAYHSGVEWGWWEGPSLCAAATAPGDAASMLGSLRGGDVMPSCTKAVWRFLGLSFAGWNALISTALTAGALYGLARSWRRSAPA